MKRIKSRNPKEVRIATREEETMMVALLRSPEDHEVKWYYADVADLVEVLADTGMRVGESLELRAEDISLEKRLITVRVTKGSPRRVPMTKRVASILKRRQESGQDRLFTLNDMQIRMAWSWARERLGIDDASTLVLHSLRKSCAHRLVEVGVDPGVIYEWLGYSLIRKEHRLARLPLHKLIAAADMLENRCNSSK
jgi:integrase